MKIIYALCVALMLAMSCKNKTNVIPANKFKVVLYEMHIAESYAQHIPKDSLHFTMKHEDSLKQFNVDILARYNITEKQFDESLNYYKSKPEILDSIYHQLLAEIAVEQSRLK